MNKDNTIENLIGQEAAKKIRDTFGGERLYIAHNHADKKRKRAHQLAHKGYTIQRIARTMQLSNRQVYRLLKQINH